MVDLESDLKEIPWFLQRGVLTKPDSPPKSLQETSFVIIGGSKGIGLGLLIKIVDVYGIKDVVVGARLESPRKQKIFEANVAALNSEGANIKIVRGDVREPAVQAKYLAAVKGLGKKVNGVYLGPAQGLIGPAADAEKMNVDMPREIVKLLSPEMTDDGMFLLPQSIPGYFFPWIILDPRYRIVAEFKKKGEKAIEEELEGTSLSLGRVIGHAIRGTDVIRLGIDRQDQETPGYKNALLRTIIGNNCANVDTMSDGLLLRFFYPDEGDVWVLGQGEFGHAPKGFVPAYRNWYNYQFKGCRKHGWAIPGEQEVGQPGYELSTALTP